MKLLAKNLKQHRLDLLATQGYRCALCGCECSIDQAVLDHCHRYGHVRAVLHRSCNAALGHIENNRFGVKDMRAFMSGVLSYLDTHKYAQDSLIHPAHKTVDERKALAKKRAARKRKLNGTP